MGSHFQNILQYTKCIASDGQLPLCVNKDTPPRVQCDQECVCLYSGLSFRISALDPQELQVGVTPRCVCTLTLLMSMLLLVTACRTAVWLLRP